MKALTEQGIAVECFERGSRLGGLWRYENDNGLSPAYASLRTNVSRARMGYPSFPMPERYPEFASHADMADYLDAYAARFRLDAHITFGATVTRLEPDPDAGWLLTCDDRQTRRFDSVVVAVGHHWCPRQPKDLGAFSGTVSHACHYRTPDPLAGRRVLVVGAGQSASEIAVEVAAVAARVCVAVRRPTHVIPRWLGGKPYDSGDTAPQNRLPWSVWNALCSRAVSRETGDPPASWPSPEGPILEDIPIISSELLTAVDHGAIIVRPALARLDGDQALFADGTTESFDDVIFATGYQISLPFLAPAGISPNGRELPLYRRIAPPAHPGLLFAGFVDAPGGLLPIVEAQAEWIAALLTGTLSLPSATTMHRAIRRGERRSRARFPNDGADSLRCDPHAYRRVVRADLRRARLRALNRGRRLDSSPAAAGLEGNGQGLDPPSIAPYRPSAGADSTSA
jgi:hypothetical protein